MKSDPTNYEDLQDMLRAVLEGGDPNLRGRTSTSWREFHDPTSFYAEPPAVGFPGGLPADRPATPPRAEPANVRSVRNNNPGDIEYSPKNDGQGQLPRDGRFVRFDTPENGRRALGKVLGSYSRRGLNTVSQVIGTLAPSSENDTAAYVRHVATRMGVGPNDPLNMQDERTLNALMDAITIHEGDHRAR